MKDKLQQIAEEAAILKQIDDQLKNLSPDVRAEAFQVLVQRHLTGSSAASTVRSGSSTRQEAPSKNRNRRTAETLTVIKDLNLRADGSVPALRDFYAEKTPDGFAECNALFAYYLAKLKEIAGIGPSHIYTCYKAVGIKVPGAFIQSLKDTARRQGWVDSSDFTDIRVTTIGENHVEHDLPRKKRSS
jgi:hypothetical protein